MGQHSQGVEETNFTTYMNGHWRIFTSLSILNFNKRLSINVWARIVDNYPTASHMIASHLGGILYTDFFVRTLPLLSENEFHNVHSGHVVSVRQHPSPLFTPSA
jgi:hypothetical protein